jgi:hypothetical protein
MAPTGWESANYFEVTIPSSLIDSDLTHFPLTLHLNATAGTGDRDVTAIFTELGASHSKLCVADASDNQLYVEVVDWQNGSNWAVLKTSLSSWTISSTGDTTIRLYFDSSHADNTSYVSATKGSAPASNVYDSDHVCVLHLNESSGDYKDSTTNGNDGTAGSEDRAQLDTPGRVIDMGDTGDGVNIASDTSFNGVGECTIELLINTDDYQQENQVLFMGYVDTSNRWYIFLDDDTNGIRAFAQVAGTPYTHVQAGIVPTDNTWHHYALTMGGSTSYWRAYFDGDNDASTFTSQVLSTFGTGQSFSVGKRTPDNDRLWNGTLSTFAIHKVERPQAYLRANRLSCLDELVSWSAEQSPPSGIGVGAASFTIAASGVGASIAAAVGASSFASSPAASGVAFTAGAAVAGVDVSLDASSFAATEATGAASAALSPSGVGIATSQAAGNSQLNAAAASSASSQATALGEIALVAGMGATSSGVSGADGDVAVEASSDAVGASTYASDGESSFGVAPSASGEAIHPVVGGIAATVEPSAAGEQTASGAGSGSITLSPAGVSGTGGPVSGVGFIGSALDAVGGGARSAATQGEAVAALLATGVGQAPNASVGSVSAQHAADAVGLALKPGVGSAVANASATSTSEVIRAGGGSAGATCSPSAGASSIAASAGSGDAAATCSGLGTSTATASASVTMACVAAAFGTVSNLAPDLGVFRTVAVANPLRSVSIVNPVRHVSITA